MSSSDEDILMLAERFFAAIEAGDIDVVRAIYAPDARVWHNHDGVTQPVEENLATLGAFIAASRGRRYAVSLRRSFDGGFVQQHVLTAVSHTGQEFVLPACIVCEVSGGRITRLDEYFDSVQCECLVAGLGRGMQQ